MRKHIIRIILASTGFALSSLINVASGQVLGGGLGGALGGGINTATGTLNGTGSLGGAFDAYPVVDRTHGSLDRVRGVTGDTGRRMGDRAKSTMGAVKNEAKGGAMDMKDSATAISAIPQEEASALTTTAVASANAAAEVAGSVDTQTATQALTNADSWVIPSADSPEQGSADIGASPQSSLLPGGLDASGPTSDGPDSTPTQPPIRGARLSGSAEGSGEADAETRL